MHFIVLSATHGSFTPFPSSLFLKKSFRVKDLLSLCGEIPVLWLAKKVKGDSHRLSMA